MALQNKHLIVNKYLEDHSLVESNITSFNNFIEHRMQEIVDELSGSIEHDEEDLDRGKNKRSTSTDREVSLSLPSPKST